MKENIFSTQPFIITFTAYPEEGIVYVDTSCKYAGGGEPCTNIVELRKGIENITGKGSYLVIDKDGECVEDERRHYIQGNLTYDLDGFKTDAVEQARKAAELVWGELPELRIGVWEQSFADVREASPAPEAH